MGKLKIGVIGLGHNGLAFCRHYAENPRCELAAVCDLDEQRADFAAAQYGAEMFTDYGILARDDIDAISIHTPDCAHREPFVKALEAGKHVFVEKPMADNTRDLAAMLAAAEAHPGRVMLVGHVLRYNKYFEMIKLWIDQGLLGDIYYVEADYIHDLRYQRHLEPWKLEEEVPMLGGGCHPLDILRWYVGDAVEVSAMSNRIAFPEMKNDASMIAMYRFAGGAVGKVTTLYGCVAGMPYGYNLSVYGTKGSVVRDKLYLDGADHAALPLPNNFDAGHSYVPEVEHFLDCILKGETPRISPKDAANTILGGLCAIKAAENGQVIAIPGAKKNYL